MFKLAKVGGFVPSMLPRWMMLGMLGKCLSPGGKMLKC